MTTIRIAASAELAVPPEAAFDFITGPDSVRNLPEVWLGKGPVPRIVKAEWVGGAPAAVGAVRRVWSADGSVTDEEVRLHERPRRHGYRLVAGLRPPLSRLVRWMEGDWTFTPSGAGTRIDWRYAWEAASPLALPLVAPLAKIFFRRAMQECLARVKERIEAAPPRV